MCVTQRTIHNIKKEIKDKLIEDGLLIENNEHFQDMKIESAA